MHKSTITQNGICCLAFILFCVCGWPGRVQGEVNGRDVAVKMDEVDTSADRKMYTTMVIERRGQKLIREMLSFQKKYGKDERQLIRFVEPPDVRDTMYLTWNYADFDADDDMWVYMSSENLVRRIGGGGKKNAFMRSDLALEDVSPREVDDDEHRLVGSESLFGADCYKVEMKARKQNDTGYSKRVVWVRKDIWLPVRIEYYNKRDRLFKTALYGGFKQIDGIWCITRGVIETPEKDSKTTVTYKDIQHNTGLEDSMFDQSNLKR